MMKARSGSIITIASVVGLVGNAGQVNYAAAKAGLVGMTKSVARELASRGVRSNAIAPGFIATDMTNALPESARDAASASIAMGRFGTPEDIAAAVAFLASDDASYITGQVIAVDGGMTFS
jgi:3-oxoacyl-[acyl-carrier protein] reductase